MPEFDLDAALEVQPDPHLCKRWRADFSMRGDWLGGEEMDRLCNIFCQSHGQIPDLERPNDTSGVALTARGEMTWSEVDDQQVELKMSIFIKASEPVAGDALEDSAHDAWHLFSMEWLPYYRFRCAAPYLTAMIPLR